MFSLKYHQTTHSSHVFLTKVMSIGPLFGFSLNFISPLPSPTHARAQKAGPYTQKAKDLPSNARSRSQSSTLNIIVVSAYSNLWLIQGLTLPLHFTCTKTFVLSTVTVWMLSFIPVRGLPYSFCKWSWKGDRMDSISVHNPPWIRKLMCT